MTTIWKYQGVKNFTLVARPHTWVSPTRELYVRGSPPPLRKCYTWGHYRAHEPHMSCTWGAPLHHWGNATREGITVHVSHTWAVREGLPLHHWGNATREGITVHVSHTWAVREGLPSTIEEMLHVRALPCTWATRELYVRGSPPPLRECYTWGHYRAREPHVSCTWGAYPPPLRKCYTWGHYRAREPTRELYVRGLPSTIEEMLHVRTLPCT